VPTKSFLHRDEPYPALSAEQNLSSKDITGSDIMKLKVMTLVGTIGPNELISSLIILTLTLLSWSFFVVHIQKHCVLCKRACNH